MKLLIEPETREVYELNGDRIIDVYGVRHYDSSSLVSATRFDAMNVFDYMKHRVLTGDLVCSRNNLGTNRERWWVIQHISPYGRCLNRNASFSCRLEDAVALKSLDTARNLFRSEHDYDLWMLNVTSLDEYARQEAQSLLVQLFLASPEDTKLISSDKELFY
jgi:hypothetical protein